MISLFVYLRPTDKILFISEFIMKRLLSIIAAFALLFSLVSCDFSNSESDSKNTTVILSKSTINFTGVGEQSAITATIVKDGKILDKAETDSEITWQSSNIAVATYENGIVTAVGYGACVIRATYGDSYAVCTVQNPSQLPLFTLSDEELLFEDIGNTYSITATRDNGLNVTEDVYWHSSNENIATCQNGVITARGYGACILTGIYESRTAICIITVEDPNLPTVTVSQSRLNLEVGESFTLSASTDVGTGKIVKWISSDENVATCVGGTVTAKANGVAAIIAENEHGYTGVCVVYVGGTIPSTFSTEHLNYEFKDLHKKLNYIDKDSGKILSSATVISYKVTTKLLDDGRLVVETTLICVKTYDSNKTRGDSPCGIATSLYREGDVFCEKDRLTSFNLSVGEMFEVKCSGFTVQTNTDGTPRSLYMTFASATE